MLMKTLGNLVTQQKLMSQLLQLILIMFVKDVNGIQLKVLQKRCNLPSIQMEQYNLNQILKLNWITNHGSLFILKKLSIPLNFQVIIWEELSYKTKMELDLQSTTWITFTSTLNLNTKYMEFSMITNGTQFMLWTTHNLKYQLVTILRLTKNPINKVQQ